MQPERASEASLPEAIPAYGTRETAMGGDASLGVGDRREHEQAFGFPDFECRKGHRARDERSPMRRRCGHGGLPAVGRGIDHATIGGQRGERDHFDRTLGEAERRRVLLPRVSAPCAPVARRRETREQISAGASGGTPRDETAARRLGLERTAAAGVHLDGDFVFTRTQPGSQVDGIVFGMRDQECGRPIARDDAVDPQAIARVGEKVEPSFRGRRFERERETEMGEGVSSKAVFVDPDRLGREICLGIAGGGREGASRWRNEGTRTSCRALRGRPCGETNAG